MRKILVIILFFIIKFGLGQDTLTLNEVTINDFLPYRANSITPITYFNINKEVLDLKNYGQDPSRIFNTTPSITTYSESGSDYGYSYIRLRGIDQTRINVTLNGVPMSEPEDQGCYFSNYPDFLQSCEMVQIQRGSGMTKNGTSSFVGNMNFESFKPKSSYVNSYLGFGSWNTIKISLNTEQKWKKFGFYSSISDIESSGYKEHSGNHSRSAFLIGNYNDDINQIKFVGFAGGQINQLAWLGSPIDSINKNRRFNSCTENEKDDFGQYHIQFHHNININEQSKFNYTLYYNYLNGGYTFDGVHIGTKDIYGYNLFSNFYGGNINYFINFGRLNLYAGINGYKYDRRHYGTTNEIHTYTNTGYRDDISFFIKAIINLDKFNLYGDVQRRYTTFAYNGDISYDTLYQKHTGVIFPEKRWDFLNYSFGIEYKIKHNILYYNISGNNREPIRNDMFYGNDYLPCDIKGNAFYLDLKPESVLDQEFGYRYIIGNFNMNINLYYMMFKNEMVLTGTMGNTGLPLKINSPSSYRTGFEMDLKYKFKFGLTFNQNVSYNKSEITWENDLKTTPVLTPDWLFYTDFNYQWKWFIIGLNCKYQNWSYIDKMNEYTIPTFYYLNSIVGLRWKFFELTGYLNNITNQKSLVNGMVDNYGSPLYFVNAPFNFHVGLKLKM